MRDKWKIMGIGILGMAVLLLSSCESSSSQEQTGKKTPEQELQEINNEVQLIDERISNYRSEAFEHEMEAQKDMLNKWGEFSQEIKKEEQAGDMVQHMEKRRQDLLERKHTLEESLKSGKK